MTGDRMALIELVEQQADTDLVRKMLAFAADRMMEPKAEARTGVSKGGARRCGRSSATETASGIGMPGPGGSRWSFRS